MILFGQWHNHLTIMVDFCSTLVKWWLKLIGWNQPLIPIAVWKHCWPCYRWQTSSININHSPSFLIMSSSPSNHHIIWNHHFTTASPALVPGVTLSDPHGASRAAHSPGALFGRAACLVGAEEPSGAPATVGTTRGWTSVMRMLRLMLMVNIVNVGHVLG